MSCRLAPRGMQHPASPPHRLPWQSSLMNASFGDGSPGSSRHLSDNHHRNNTTGGPGQLINYIQGSWSNADCPGEQYIIQGLQVTRTDARGTWHFSLRWDQRGQRWQWGTRGRLSLLWLGSDSIAWVPEVGGSDTHAARPWRWQRCRLSPSQGANTSTNFDGRSSDNLEPRRHRRSYSHTVHLYPSHSFHRSQGFAQPQRDCRSRSRGADRRNYQSHRNGGHGDHARGNHRTRQQRMQAESRSNVRLPCGLTSVEVSDLFSREITPDDYDLLLRLDDAVEKPTVSAEDVDKLPVVACADFAGGDCAICLTAFQDDDEVTALPCRHNFHRECIATWLSKYHRTCPLCHQEAPLGKAFTAPQD